MDEFLETRQDLGAYRDIQHVPGALDIGVEQRCRIAQPTAGVHHAVVDDIDAGHRRGQYLVVPDIADEALHVEIVDADGVGALTHHHPDVLPIGHQLAHHVRTEVTVGAYDEGPHRAMPFIHSDASSSSVPSSCAFLHHFIAADRNLNGL